MASIRDITAKDVMDPEPVTVNIGQTLSKVRSRMEKHNLRAIPVVDGHKFVGMLGYRELVEKVRSDPSSTKVESLVHTPPEIVEEHNLVELADTRINSGRKLFALVGDQDRLVGAIGEPEMVYAAKDADELQTVPVRDLMTPDVITVEEDESHETARSIMMDNNISRLAVVDVNGNLTAVITSNDIMRAMIPREQMTDGDYKHHKESLSDIPVTEIMQIKEEFNATIIEDDGAPLPEAIGKMQQDDKQEVIVTENDVPVGILTLKDIIDYMAGHEAVESLRVQITGAEVSEEQSAIMDKVETALQGGLGRVLVRPDELVVHVKKYEKEGSRHKYSLNFKLSSELGLTTVKEHGWDLLNVVDEGLDELETVVKKEKEKTRDEYRDRERKGKYR